MTPIEAMIAAELAATGRRSTRRFHGFVFGKTGQRLALGRRRACERESEDCDGGDAGSHGLRIGSALGVSDPSRQVPEDLLPAKASLAMPTLRMRELRSCIRLN